MLIPRILDEESLVATVHPFVQFSPQPKTEGAVQRGPSFR